MSAATASLALPAVIDVGTQEQLRVEFRKTWCRWKKVFTAKANRRQRHRQKTLSKIPKKEGQAASRLRKKRRYQKMVGAHVLGFIDFANQQVQPTMVLGKIQEVTVDEYSSLSFFIVIECSDATIGIANPPQTMWMSKEVNMLVALEDIAPTSTTVTTETAASSDSADSGGITDDAGSHWGGEGFRESTADEHVPIASCDNDEVLENAPEVPVVSRVEYLLQENRKATAKQTADHSASTGQDNLLDSLPHKDLGLGQLTLPEPSPTTPRPQHPSPPPVGRPQMFDAGRAEEEVEIFEVRHVCAERMYEGVLETLLSFRHHPLRKGTWEPESSLGGCREAVDAFHKEREAYEALGHAFIGCCGLCGKAVHPLDAHLSEPIENDDGDGNTSFLLHSRCLPSYFGVDL